MSVSRGRLEMPTAGVKPWHPRPLPPTFHSKQQQQQQQQYLHYCATHKRLCTSRPRALLKDTVQEAWKAPAAKEKDPQITSSIESTEFFNTWSTWSTVEEEDPEPGECLFCYGSYMFQDQLLKRDVKVRYRDPAVIKDPNIKMVFKHKGGHATLERMDPGKSPRFPPLPTAYGPGGMQAPPRVHGVLYQVPTGTLTKVQAAARADGFVLTPIEVETYDGSVQCTAQALVSGPLSHLLGDEVIPPERYMKMLREGAADNFLDPAYQAWLSGIETVPCTGLPFAYWNTPSRYISLTFFLTAMILAGSILYDYL